ncbi:aspartate ammonia-lyase [Lachnospiraceae bacterium JC7]|nr:aspartate ammonia-lyase [Lachnospiraceae bacterium JC7]
MARGFMESTVGKRAGKNEVKTVKMNNIEYRIEHDSIGDKEVPVGVYYGVQTLRAAENFRITGLTMHPEIVNSLAYIKKAAAITNCEIGLLDRKVTEAIVNACDEILAGKFRNDFIVDPIQGGAGTSLNMNANEVIANRAIEIMGGQKGDYSIVHPNDHVNLGQSTNDVIPTAGKMTTIRLLKNLKVQILRLHEALLLKAKELNHVIKMGRTQMQDAVPIRLGQEFKAYADAVMRDINRMDKALDEMKSLNMGGTAIGTGINADEAYLRRIIPVLNEVSDLDFIQAFDLIDATQNLDPFVAVSGAVKACAVTLSKIANDLRLMSSGPRAGFGEINLPAKQNGSSIMPGKVNPVIPEVVNQVAFNVIGNDMTITMAAEAGQLELNAFEPIIFYNLFQSIDTLGFAVETFVDNCVSGITANEERCKYLVENSVGIITALSPHLGYQKSSDIAKKALKLNKSVREIVMEEKILTEEEIAEILDPVNMTEPGISGKKLMGKLQEKK